MKTRAIQGVVKKHHGERGGLISILEDIQANYGYLSADALQIVAEETGRSLVDVFGVATFYRSFSMEPRGKHLCSVCMGTACHVRGAPAVAGEFERQLDVRSGATTKDRQFTLATVNCLGACALGPVAVVDGHYFSNLKPRCQAVCRVGELSSLQPQPHGPLVRDRSRAVGPRDGGVEPPSRLDADVGGVGELQGPLRIPCPQGHRC
jgi:NADH-quinone oxidoreductase subunit E